MLTLVEETLLLALDDESGNFHPLPEYSLPLALGGAVLMDLALQDKLDSDLQGMMVVDTTPVGDDILDPVLEQLRGIETRLQPRTWLMRLARTGFIKEHALARLVGRGILRREEKRVLWVFGSRRYPVIDDREEREAKLRILEVLLRGEIPDPRTVVLICLADACSLFPWILSRQDLPAVSDRIHQVTKMDLIGRKMLGELRELHETVKRVGYWGLGEAIDGLESESSS